MRTAKLSAVILICGTFILVNGCADQMAALRSQNNAQQQVIDDLKGKLEKANLDNAQLQNKLATRQGMGDADLEKLQQQVALYKKTIDDKDKLIAQMQKQLLNGGTALPPELSTLLEDFAKANSGMVTYDAEKGIVKFSSDLLFNKGSDEVASSAATAVKKLCEILNSQEAKDFDIVIAGHTDDIPIQKPETLKLHPTNWHLSVHRAIAVEKVMESASVAPERMSVRGFGEYRPVVPNAPNKGGAEQNRRVEIYIVPKGA
jgi:chemotaxis protein MotB